MAVTLRQFALFLALAAAPLGACASVQEGPTTGPYSEVLAELPADAPPGECYAKVVVPGERVEAPPVAQGATWVISQSPAGPVYCLVPNGPAIQPVAETISRYGWIRVLCDQDATPERITRVQTRLHDRGYYRGQASGRYDRETAQAVASFQSSVHINHGGYLSLQTLSALDASGPVYAHAASPVVVAQPQQAASYGYAGAYSYQQSASAYAYASPVYASPQYAPPVYAPQAAAPCDCDAGYPPPPLPPQAYYPPQPVYAGPPPGAYPCCAGGVGGGVSVETYGYSRGPSGGYGFGNPPVVQNGWLMWNSKSRF